MKVTHYKEILPVTMNNDTVKNVAGRVLIGKKDGANNFCMRLFEIGPGGYSPKHNHDWEHELFIHDGNGEVFMEGKWHPVSKGSAVFVPPNVEHQIRNASDKKFTFICLVPPAAPEI